MATRTLHRHPAVCCVRPTLHHHSHFMALYIPPPILPMENACWGSSVTCRRAQSRPEPSLRAEPMLSTDPWTCQPLHMAFLTPHRRGRPSALAPGALRSTSHSTPVAATSLHPSPLESAREQDSVPLPFAFSQLQASPQGAPLGVSVHCDIPPAPERVLTPPQEVRLGQASEDLGLWGSLASRPAWAAL